jgi:hypothetical protein
MKRGTHPYRSEEESITISVAIEIAEQEKFVIPDDVDYADVVEGILQVTPDIEEEIAAVDRGETVQMDEFKTMFAKWLG